MQERFMSNLIGLSFMKWWFLLIPKVGMTLFFGYVCYMGWMSLGPRKPVPDVAMMKVADQAVDKIVGEIYQKRGDVKSAVLCHFGNDTTDYFSNKLRGRIEKSNIIALEDVGFLEKLRTVLNLRNRGVSTTDDALHKARHHSVDGVLWGRIDRYESVKGRATLIGEWQLLDKSTGAVICGAAISEGAGATSFVEAVTTLGQSTMEIEVAASAVPWYVRLLGFVLIALLLPIVTISFIRLMVSKRSNRVNAFVLGIYTVIDMILAFMMIGGVFSSFAVIVIFLLASVLAFFYNVSLMSFALRLETE